MFSDLGGRPRQWGFGKRDHSHAYKNSPLRPSDSRRAYIALFNPIDKCWYAREPLALLFGETANVLHYNTFSRISPSIVMKVLSIPVVAFYDDFGFPIDREIASIGLEAFKELSSLLGLS